MTATAGLDLAGLVGAGHPAEHAFTDALAEDDDEDEEFRALIAAGEAAGVSDRSAEEDADIEVLHCHITGCLATQAKVCGTCGNHICTTHYVNSPVAGEPKMCLDCEERHPLRRYNMLDAYNELAAWAKEARMGITLTEGTDTLTAVVKGAKGNPVAALRSHDNGTLTGKTASGEGPWRTKKGDVEIAVTRGVRA